jgi:GTP-binding protein
MFIDQAEIFVQSGKGGDGMVHFRREKYVPRGGPDGGDGGRGADAILEVRPTLNTLATFRHTTHFVAPDGKNGGSNNKHGRSADSLVIDVPPGTLVYDAASNTLVGDLTQPGQRLLACRGGRGGRGNTHFKSSVHQTPRTAERGEPGEQKRLRLELKLIADIGIVGVPNAGKSTLLSVLTNARPKIAPYPFTTLEPNLGVAELPDGGSAVLADIPGLIEGASQGAGLGFEFLRHIQRTRVLIHLLDGLSADPLADYSQIGAEMALFDPALARKPQIVAVNKADQPGVEEHWAEWKRQFKKRKVELRLVSALAHTGVQELLQDAVRLLAESPAPEPAPDELPVYRPAEDPRAFLVSREGTDWRVKGAAIERAAAMTFWQHDGSVRRFQRLMEYLGVDRALQQAGAHEGDTVRIGEDELEYQE